MFSGIIEAIGTIKSINQNEKCIDFSILADANFDDLKLGDSISVNGVCLTVTDFSGLIFNVTAVPETLRLTNLQYLTVDQTVNLERALKFNGRISGHYVQGHIDCIGEIIDIKEDGSNVLLVKVLIDPKIAKYIVQKGYIAIDGMSITIIDIADEYFSVVFIPHTQKTTIVQYYKQGSILNIEVDILGKYVEKLIQNK